MLALTDSLAAGRRLLGGAGRWEARRATSFEAGVRDLAVALLGDRPLFAAEHPVVPPWRVCVVAARAPRSQLDRLAEFLEREGPRPHAFLAAAVEGTGFHGAGGRPWVTAPGNLHLVAGGACDLNAREGAAALAAMGPLAGIEAVDAFPALRDCAGLRWVNDIVLGGAKVGGSLVRTRSAGDRITDALVALGLNVEVTPRVPPDPVVRAVTSLREQVGVAESCTLAGVQDDVVRRLALHWAALERGETRGIVEGYRARSVVVGRWVAIYPDSGRRGEDLPSIRRGRVQALREDMALVIEGFPSPITSGRAVLLDEIAGDW
jgi:BirA family biotin operon repressor/biotin-[acetyl-CoA-carboxylase] ligase